ncbi:MAG: DUF551 domain-containing protein [Clostridia bacterium]|nr:DUF551 domain-containing protein [Clostridia bacterium]
MNDYVSRQAVIDYLMINMGWHDEDDREIDDWDEKKPIITDLINGVPSGWISVKDRLPEDYQEVLFIGKNQHGNTYMAQRGHRNGNDWYSAISRINVYKENATVTHWMPLPEPPKEETE